MADDDYLKPILDLAAAVGTKGVTSAMRWPEQIKNAVGSTVDAAKLPGDVVTGKVDPLSDEGVRRAVDLAGSMTLGAGAMEAPAGALHAGLMRPKSEGIIAYHGSPHSFDRFDLSKIGTGEGAQAYGHGLYFAEAEPVAQMYRDNLSRRNIDATLDGRPIDKWPATVDEVSKDNWRLGKLLDDYGRVGGKYEDFVRQQKDWYRGQPEMDAALGEFEKRVAAQHTPGSMYQVRINADPEHFLDWDRPLSEHPEIVRRKLGWTPEAEAKFHSAQSADDDALLAALEGGGNYAQSRIPVPAGLPPLSATGEDIVRGRSVFDRASDIEKANRLREAGIPGLKYLDQGSRAVGEGSRNYVVFDDKLIDILRKYAKGGEVDGLLQDRFPSHYMPDVGRQVMQDGGAPSYSAPITGQHTITLDDLIGRAPGPASQMGAYTDAGGQRISAPFVTSTAGGYPVYSPQTQPEKASNPYDVSGLLGRIFGKGRQGYATQGGVPEVEDALRVAREAQDREAMSHPVGMSGKVEFAPVRLREPLSGYEMKLGSVPKESAALINPALDIATDTAPYFTPLAPLAAARDAAVGLREGDPLSVGMAALGAPGRVGKAALMATSAMAPTEAEASPRTDFIRRVIDSVRHQYAPDAVNKLSAVKLTRPVSEMDVRLGNERDLLPRRIVSPEQFEGGAFVPAFGDRSRSGADLLAINGQKLKTPVNLQGGESFMRDTAAQGPDYSIWGGGLSPSQALARKGAEVAAKGMDPYLIYSAMGPESADYSHMMTDTLLGLMNRKRIPTEIADDFDSKMRRTFKTLEAIDAWPGIKAKGLEDWLYGGEEAAGLARTKMAKVMDAAGYRNAGMPEVGAVRAAITEPGLLGLPSYASGYSIGALDPAGRVIKDPIHPHGSYPTQVGAPHGAPGYVGGFEYSLPSEIHFKDEIDRIHREKPGLDDSHIQYTLRRRLPVVEATPEWVDNASEFIRQMRNEYGPAGQ